MTGSPSPEPQPKAPNLFVRLGQVFFSPGDLFEALRRRPVWIDMFILLLVVTLASQLLMPEERFREIFMQQMPPETDPADAEQIMGFARTWGMAFAVGWLLVAPTVIAGLILLIYNVLLGGEARFKQMFSAAIHSFAILSAGGLLVFALILNGSEQVVMSPAMILPDLGDGYLARLLGGINIFAVWTCAVLGIAISKFYPKRSAFGGTMVLFALYMVLVGLSAIPG